VSAFASSSSPPAWLFPPEEELGAVAPVDVLFARTDRLVLALRNAVVYSTGFVVDLALRIRPGSGLDGQRLALEGMRSRALLLAHLGDRAIVDDGLALRVEYPDGRRATNAEHHAAFGDAPPLALSTANGGGGGGTPYACSACFYVSPLPPRGTLAVTVAWPAAGIAPTTRELDASPILAAAERSGSFWDEPRDG
jgi:hypothetical protein